MSEVHVHGVVAAAERVEVEGARRIGHRDVAALVSEAAPGELRAAQVLRSHWRVLEKAAARATVLPVRFGTVLVGDDAVVEEFLAPRHDELAATLAELAGKVQLTVKGFYDEEALLRGVIEGSPSVDRLRRRISGVPEAAAHYERIELGQMVAAEVDRVRERDSALVLERLEPLAVAARHEAATGATDAVNAAFLVERSRLDKFSQAVGVLGRELEGRITLRYVGPLPPYSFAGQDAAASWA